MHVNWHLALMDLYCWASFDLICLPIHLVDCICFIDRKNSSIGLVHVDDWKDWSLLLYFIQPRLLTYTIQLLGFNDLGYESSKTMSIVIEVSLILTSLLGLNIRFGIVLSWLLFQFVVMVLFKYRLGGSWLNLTYWFLMILTRGGQGRP